MQEQQNNSRKRLNSKKRFSLIFNNKKNTNLKNEKVLKKNYKMEAADNKTNFNIENIQKILTTQQHLYNETTDEDKQQQKEHQTNYSIPVDPCLNLNKNNSNKLETDFKQKNNLESSKLNGFRLKKLPRLDNISVSSTSTVLIIDDDDEKELNKIDQIKNKNSKSTQTLTDYTNTEQPYRNNNSKEYDSYSIGKLIYN